MMMIVLSILLSLGYFYMGFFGYFLQKKAPANRLFLGLTVLFSGWVFSGTFYNIDQYEPALTMTWMLMSYLIWTIGTAFILHFCLVLRKDAKPLSRGVLAAVYLPAVLLLAGMLWANGLAASTEIHTSPLQFIFGIPGGIAFYVVYISVSIGQLIKRGRTSDDFRVKRQSRLISGALVTASILVGVYGFVLPGIVAAPLPVLLPFFPAIWIVSMWISITKYGFLAVTMEIATKSILDNIQEIIILTDRNSMILDVNRKFEEVVQLRKDSINGRLLEDVLTSNPAIKDHIARILDGRLPSYTGDVDFHLDGGKPLPIRIHITPIIDRLDHVVGIVIAANDLTLEKKFELQSITDSLTLANNRMRIERIIERFLGDREPLSLILFDLDHFKSINDTCGHAAGDHVLRLTVEVVNRELRANDHLGRWGGEEFLIALPGASAEVACQVSERIRAAVAACNFGLNRPVTISCGVASNEDGAATLTALVSQADAAMYEAKHTGRNRTVRHTALSSS